MRFDIKRPHENLEEFQQRINKAMREDDYQSSQANDKWYLGPNNRDVGSIRSDIWEDTAIDLFQSNYIAIFPVIWLKLEVESLLELNQIKIITKL